MQETLVDHLAQILSPLLGHLTKPTQVSLLLHFITKLDISLRKQLITLCRALSVPVHETSLFAKTSHILTLIERSAIQRTITNLYTDPLTAGVLVALCISLPLSERAIRETYTRMLAKEMLVMETSPLPSIINYNCFFGSVNEPIHPTVPANPRQAAAINAIIDRWITSLESKPVIFPHMTTKLCSKATQRLVRDRYPEYVTFEEEGATQSDLEYLYMTEGDRLDGSPCEIKQRWYTAQLFPRTYFAAGSEAYHKSKYLRNALNSLCDYLPPTERFSRVNPHRILLSSAQSHAIIYDLTSFTSNMHEQRHFLQRLAMYCKGHQVRVLDSCEGVIPVDLGDLLSEYNSLNTEPRYTSDSLSDTDHCLELSHCTAGFLGVFGNLASCTFLHGAVMSQLVENFSQLGVAGDDGCIDSLDDFTTYFVIRLLGLAEESKGYTTLDPGYQIYLKRPIRQVQTRLFAESFALYSMFEHLFESDDRRFFPVQRAKLERKRSLASSIVSYMRSLTRIALSAEEKEAVRTFLQGIYRLSGFPEAGHIPYIHTEYQSHIGRLPTTLIPTLEAFGQDPIETTIKSLYDGVAVLPERVDEPIAFDNDSAYAGCSFSCTGSSVLSYYRKMGLVDLTQDEVVYTGEDGMERMLRHFSFSRDYPLYTVIILRDIPDHLLI